MGCISITYQKINTAAKQVLAYLLSTRGWMVWSASINRDNSLTKTLLRLKCWSSVYVHQSIQFCQSQWLRAYAKWVFSGWSESPKCDLVVLLLIEWHSHHQHKSSSFIHCIWGEKVGWAGQLHMRTLLDLSHQGQAKLVGLTLCAG